MGCNCGKSAVKKTAPKQVVKKSTSAVAKRGGIKRVVRRPAK